MSRAAERGNMVYVQAAASDRPLRVCKLSDPGPTKRLIDITVTAVKSKIGL